MKVYDIRCTPSGEFRSEVICRGCGKTLVITRKTEGLLKQVISKQKYCDECAKNAIKVSNHTNKKEPTRKDRVEDSFGIREFNEGYKRFWEKRGYKPPAVNQYVLEKL